MAAAGPVCPAQAAVQGTRTHTCYNFDGTMFLYRMLAPPPLYLPGLSALPGFLKILSPDCQTKSPAPPSHYIQCKKGFLAYFNALFTRGVW